ncbi:bifunctional 3-(3-hydroxy-phenyl)propionate/3-hydroxycinnamic acid hydroxylase [Roseomonas indoligenes]|uniref:Bifunctional 3-(3-hydroxy-phenyl)propionate/3-hydroxycinnamic acid hydroxylase n=1 Tax=Roseomonas indoligenes TaxID=2820811 RepID=A0A940N1U3_9PROT|nr:bifunctional 3-(3-hydroxy-phenyl)propionate/3-hydroxycinnamic acid hydroxylase [Pararoseomonas indoligenes]
MRAPDHYDVAVIGFGPSGAVATALLAQAGLRTLAIDRAREVWDKPRAIAIDHEILRVLDNLGVAERVLPHVAPFPASEHFGAQGQLIRRIDMVPEPYPLGYVPTMVFTQPPVEAALRDHAAGLPGAEVALGVELLSLEQDAERVTLRLRGEDGAERTVTADYAIGCDGATSTVRRALGIRYQDLVFDEPWLVVDVLVHEDALAHLPANAAQYCDPARPVTYIVGPGRHRRWEIMLLPGEDPRAMEAEAAVWRLLSRWVTPEDATLWRASSYRFHALVAAQWRQGRVFLAGDAAHQQPPFIGQGMCQGVRDVANLAWKLAQVHRTGPDDALLDTYGRERDAHVRELTARIKHIGEYICERDPEAARARDARLLAEGGGTARTVTRQEIVPPLSAGLLAAGAHPANGTLFPQPWVRDGTGGRVRLDTVAGHGWRLVLRGMPGPAASGDLTVLHLLEPGEAAPGAGLAATELDGVAAAWFARHGARAAIVRPDHYVFGTAADSVGLARLLDDLRARLPNLLLPLATSPEHAE